MRWAVFGGKGYGTSVWLHPESTPPSSTAGASSGGGVLPASPRGPPSSWAPVSLARPASATAGDPSLTSLPPSGEAAPPEQAAAAAIGRTSVSRRRRIEQDIARIAPVRRPSARRGVE